MKCAAPIALLIPVAIWTLSCSGADNKSLTEKHLENVDDNYDPVTAILGENPELDTSEEDTGEELAAMEAPLSPDEDLIGGEMGVFLPTIMLNGKEEPGVYTVKLADNAGTLVQSDVPSSEELTLQPGVYDMVFTTKKVNGETELRGVEIIKGRRLKQTVKFRVGQITLLTSEGGCSVTKIKIRKKDSSDWLPGNYTTCKPIFLPEGEYVADKAGTEVTGIVVYDGGTRNIVIRSSK